MSLNSPSSSRQWAVWAVASCALVAAVWATPASAQRSKPDAKARYDRKIARCNHAGLPDPAREGCIRRAGLAFDRATGGITGTRKTTTPDGRSIVMVPSTGVAEPAGSQRFDAESPRLVTSPDGRTTLVRPAVP